MDNTIRGPGGAEHLGTVDRLLSRFGRITSGQKLIPEIDGLRFLAIGAVFAYHANTLAARARAEASGWVEGDDLWPWLLENSLTASLSKGFLGVDIFFAISGFILGLPFARHFRQGAPPKDRRIRVRGGRQVGGRRRSVGGQRRAVGARVWQLPATGWALADRPGRAPERRPTALSRRP